MKRRCKNVHLVFISSESEQNEEKVPWFDSLESATAVTITFGSRYMVRSRLGLGILL